MTKSEGLLKPIYSLWPQLPQNASPGVTTELHLGQAWVTISMLGCAIAGAAATGAEAANNGAVTEATAAGATDALDAGSAGTDAKGAAWTSAAFSNRSGILAAMASPLALSSSARRLAASREPRNCCSASCRLMPWILANYTWQQPRI